MEWKKQDAFLLAGFLVLGALLVPLRGGFTDDGFIHIQYARNLIERGEYSFNPGEVSFGTTSPLWVMVQAVLGMAFGGKDALMATSRFASWAAGFLSLLALYATMRLAVRSRPAALLAVLALASDGWFVRWTAMSMETSSAVLASLLMGLFSLKACEDRRFAGLLGFFIGITSLLRPEAYLFFAVYLFALASTRGDFDSRCAVRTILMFLAVAVPWLLFAKLHMGSFLPNTAGAKSGGIVTDPVQFVKKFSPIVKIIGATQAIWVLAVLTSLIVERGASPVFERKYRHMSICTVSLPVAYVFFDMQVLSRYLLIVTPFILVLGMACVVRLARRFALGTRGRWLAAGSVAAVAVVASVVFYFVVIVPPSRAFSRDLTHELKDLALYLDRNSRPDAVVAAADIGYLAFYSNRRVLDLGGLVEPATGELRKRYTYEEIVERGLYLDLAAYPKVDYFIDRVEVPRRFDGKVINGRRFAAVLVKVVDNLGIRKPGPFYYTLYELHPVGAREGSSGRS